MHSAVYNYLLQVGALTFSTSALSTGGKSPGAVGLTSAEVAYDMGLRVVVDDMLAPDTSVKRMSTPSMMANSAVAEGVQQELRLLRIATSSLQDVLAVDYHYGFRQRHQVGRRWRQPHQRPTRNRLQLGAGLH